MGYLMFFFCFCKDTEVAVSSDEMELLLRGKVMQGI